MIINNDTIAAVSTPPGIGGIAVIRVSGPEALTIVGNAWRGTDLSGVASHSAHLGKYINKEGDLIDECVATIFKAPSSFTGENIVEISVHGSSWIQRAVLSDLIKRGARIANPGEFTLRAFINGKMDLAQAEGVADLISSSSKAAHDMAISQTRGAFSKEFNLLREELIEFASLLELELDFSEEDVEFADRAKLTSLLEDILQKINKLSASYARGSVLKSGVPVVIAGVPNAGKSSLLNLLLEDEKAIVTDIPGTTRDTIEDTIERDGVLYRFIDTAGLRETSDIVEEIGVDRALTAMSKAFIIIWMIDSSAEIKHQIEKFKKFKLQNPDKNIIILLNKTDLLSESSKINENSAITSIDSIIPFSTHTGEGLTKLLQRLGEISKQNANPETDIIITNARHYDALIKASEALTRALGALTPCPSENSGCPNKLIEQPLSFPLPVDFIAQDIRETISHLSLITGTITTDTLLQSIFSRFCIGK